MGGIPVNQIVLQRNNDVEYYKSVPQTGFEMLGLNIRQDLRHPHCYLYRNGREIDKEHLVWEIPDNCLLRATASPSCPVTIRLPDTASTFSSCATASALSVDIRRSETSIVLTPEREAVIFFVAFTGRYRAWEAIPTTSYTVASSSSGLPSSSGRGESSSGP